MLSASYNIQRPIVAAVPIVLSVPHAGTELPPEIAAALRPEIRAELPDTDWLVPELYNFCLDMGIVMISAKLSRYVIDLNRPVTGPALYQDQRRQTDAVPLSSFSGEHLYLVNREPDAVERQRRIDLYYEPYHKALAQLIFEAKQSFGKVLLFDAHSIRRVVPSLAAEPFADLIVGDRDGTSSASSLSQCLISNLASSGLTVSYNQPFKGGQITRAYGRPNQGVHALQLEMSQDIYLSQDGRKLDPLRTGLLRPILQKSLRALIHEMGLL